MEAKNEADGTFGYTLEELLKIEAPPPPEDFAEFWDCISFCMVFLLLRRITLHPGLE